MHIEKSRNSYKLWCRRFEAVADQARGCEHAIHTYQWPIHLHMIILISSRFPFPMLAYLRRLAAAHHDTQRVARG